MSKKGMKIELNQSSASLVRNKGEETIESKDVLTAVEVTTMATDFLSGLGHKSIKPIKVTQEEFNHFVVEVDLKKKNAMVVIDANAKEIKEYEINEIKKAPRTASPISPKLILLIIGIQILFTILFNFLSDYLPIPFL